MQQENLIILQIILLTFLLNSCNRARARSLYYARFMRGDNKKRELYHIQQLCQ